MNKGMEILNKKKSNDFWEPGTVFQRSGKATGKYRHFWYVRDPASGEMVEHDTEKDWESWKLNKTLLMDEENYEEAESWTNKLRKQLKHQQIKD